MADIEERLRSHAQAFDGLLSLIPAKYYYGEDTSDQWQRKKQTKQQARDAKRAKLDPDSSKSAKDIMDENARKRKRDEDGESESSDGELGSELPKEGMKRGDGKSKKQKQPEDEEDSEQKPGKSAEDVESKKKAKEEKNALKKAAQKERKKAKEAAKKEKMTNKQNKASEEKPQQQESKPSNNKADEQQNQIAEEDSGSDENDDDEVGEKIALKFNPEGDQASTNSSTPNSPGFDAPNAQSGSSSISSIVPPSAPTDSSDKPAEPKPLKPTPEELKQRLQKRLDELRAARHADGLNGKPARNRQELIEARRQKAEQRKAHKKLLRQKAKEEEQRAKDDAMARRFSPGGSGSLLASPRSPAESTGSANNFSFGRMVFTDGGHTDASLTSLRDQPKRAGPQDAATALKAAEAKKSRLAGLDEEKRADIEEKDRWLNAKKHAHGERVRDNTSLLKKALKRKESAKKKSEREWKERMNTIQRDKESRQAKREENLRKRREEKGSKGKKGSKKKARPGFEGSFKARSGGKK